MYFNDILVGRQYDDCDGLLRASGGGNGNSCKCPSGSLRIHGFLHRGCKAGVPFLKIKIHSQDICDVVHSILSKLSCFFKVQRLENAVGWYHSHPGYGCWLSGIDVNTQMLHQQFEEPFSAIVVRNFFMYQFKLYSHDCSKYWNLSCFQIDPVRTISAGKVNLGAFRTYPKVRLE